MRTNLTMSYNVFVVDVTLTVAPCKTGTDISLHTVRLEADLYQARKKLVRFGNDDFKVGFDWFPRYKFYLVWGQ